MIGGATTGTGTAGGAAGSGAGNAAATGGVNGRGAAIGAGRLIFGLGADASTCTGAGACCAGTMRF
jgi:hypothetical protein